jgi:hypothetical protein
LAASEIGPAKLRLPSWAWPEKMAMAHSCFALYLKTNSALPGTQRCCVMKGASQSSTATIT